MSASQQERPLVILGSTGSIGVNTLAVAKHLGIPVHGISGHSRIDRLAEQAREHDVRVVVGTDPARHAALRKLLADRPDIDVRSGPESLSELAADPAAPVVLTAVVGGAGLPATMAAVEAGKRVCIANKEPLVMAGALIVDAAVANGAQLLPVDSEHSAIFQCLQGHGTAGCRRIVLTASGGPFRERADLDSVTREEALRHPTWEMGPKITIDSATLMNKSLEVIEAHWLFAVPPAKIAVVIHPQSVVHSLVEFVDGSTLAQLGQPDMRTPIQYALTFPDHLPSPVEPVDLLHLSDLHFTAPDEDRFPSLAFGRSALASGGIAPTVLNAANEVAVAGFLAGRRSFLGIYELIADELARCPAIQQPSLADILAADQAVRERHQSR